MCIVDSRDQVLQRKTVRLVRVLWQHRGVMNSCVRMCLKFLIRMYSFL